MRRSSIVSMMRSVSFLAVGLAALRNASDEWAGAMTLLTMGALGTSALGMLHHRGEERAWWVGFSLFCGTYLLVAFVPWFSDIKKTLGTTQSLIALNSEAMSARSGFSELSRLKAQLNYESAHLKHINPNDLEYVLARQRKNKLEARSSALEDRLAANSAAATPAAPAALPRLLPGAENLGPFLQIGHCLSALLSGWIGGFLSSRMYRASRTDASAAPRGQ